MFLKIKHMTQTQLYCRQSMQVVPNESISSRVLCSLSMPLFRSSRPELFCRKGALRNFAKFTGKHLCQSLFFDKVEGLRPATLLKRRVWHRCFPVNFRKFLKTPFFIAMFFCIFRDLYQRYKHLLLKVHRSQLTSLIKQFSEKFVKLCLYMCTYL